MRISIVIPVYGGAGTVGALCESLLREFAGRDTRIVLVNDDSPDSADEVCRALVGAHPDQVVYARLSRNFGEHNAVMAGLRLADGDFVLIMDDDFQNPPAEAVALADFAAANDFDVVYTRYERKAHSAWRNWGSRFNDLTASWLLQKPRGLYLSSFKCLSRFLVDEITRYDGPYPYIDGLVLRTTRRIGVLTVRHDPRDAGESTYSVRKLVRLWLNMFVNFSVMPLRLSTLAGFVAIVVGTLLGASVVIEKLLRPDTPMGYASIMTTLLVFSGMSLFMLGVTGEYVGRLFLTANRTPQYVIRDVMRQDRDGK
ncbi:MAG: glycosyltransferase [Deltaproteobacteria bacterium]|nr:glycosyltransferase [Deltaproteobacteria bacterium]